MCLTFLLKGEGKLLIILYSSLRKLGIVFQKLFSIGDQIQSLLVSRLQSEQHRHGCWIYFMQDERLTGISGTASSTALIVDWNCSKLRAACHLLCELGNL